MDIEKLMSIARDTAENSYSPYSKFRVGAALLCKNGEVIQGVNIENRSFGLTICAERSAISAAITKGINEFQAIAVYCPDADYPVSPCGACRQVLSEFVDKDFPIYFEGHTGGRIQRKMSELFPDDALGELKNQ